MLRELLRQQRLIHAKIVLGTIKVEENTGYGVVDRTPEAAWLAGAATSMIEDRLAFAEQLRAAAQQHLKLAVSSHRDPDPTAG